MVFGPTKLHLIQRNLSKEFWSKTGWLHEQIDSKRTCLPCDTGWAKEPRMMYFPTKWGAKEHQNPQNDEDDSLRSALQFVFRVIPGGSFLNQRDGPRSEWFGNMVVAIGWNRDSGGFRRPSGISKIHKNKHGYPLASGSFPFSIWES